jgi:multicomponent Na+:H+ antiporter subunit C
MELLLVILIGLLYAAGVYLILRRSMVKLLFGILLLGSGTNMLIFLLGGITKGKPPQKMPNYSRISLRILSHNL